MVLNCRSGLGFIHWTD